jgi:hypothetical protein
MNRKRLLALASGLVAIAAVALLLTQVVFPGAAGTGAPGVATPDVASAPMVVSAAIAPAVQETAPAPGSPQEGIKVHGHWTIEVTNPDGSLAERREFDNAIHPAGPQTLAKVLGRQNSVGGWQITLVGAPAPFSGGGGIIREASYLGTEPYIFKTLTVDVPTSGANADKLVLSGTATAMNDGNIGLVATFVMRLNSSSPPLSYYPPEMAYGITNTNLASPVSLLTGQQVLVTVVISFS